MSRKPTRAQNTAQFHPDPPQRARAELEFDEPAVLGDLFGQFDANLVLLENRLGVYIAARGNRIQIEGSDDSVARARDVLKGMQQRLRQGHELDVGAVDALIMICLLYTSPSPRDRTRSRMPSSA